MHNKDADNEPYVLIVSLSQKIPNFLLHTNAFIIYSNTSLDVCFNNSF